MDPTQALASILCGHMVADHVEALTEWLASGGFDAAILPMPADKHEFFAAHCERQYGDAAGLCIEVKADKRGIWTQGASEQQEDDWNLVGRWFEISKLDDSEY